jgi:conjugal transfer pilus assembly protein TraB
VVGVDATTAVKSQSDPLPVVLRITGPARSVYAEGKLLRTNLTGCMVNGAAIADLSSEKVYVKLQRMTCPQPGGRIAVSEVKGFIAFGGKTGARPCGQPRGQSGQPGLHRRDLRRVGRGASTNAQAFLTSPSVSVSGTRSTLSAGDIATGGLGQGLASSADMVSKYLIERPNNISRSSKCRPGSGRGGVPRGHVHPQLMELGCVDCLSRGR